MKKIDNFKYLRNISLEIKNLLLFLKQKMDIIVGFSASKYSTFAHRYQKKILLLGIES